MNIVGDAIKIEMIPVDQIAVINPRVRNKKKFLEIVDSVSKVGLKRPITVSPNPKANGAQPYNLVCGQGRLEAFMSLGEKKIAAIVVDASTEDALIMSLVENLARRQHTPLELLHDIGELRKRGYSEKAIASKTGLSYEYVRSIRHLLDAGEEKLLSAVEAGHIPVSVAIDISETDEEGAQEALAQAYQDGRLRGKKLLAAKRIVFQRQKRGKGVRLTPYAGSLSANLTETPAPLGITVGRWR